MTAAMKARIGPFTADEIKKARVALRSAPGVISVETINPCAGFFRLDIIYDSNTTNEDTLMGIAEKEAEGML